MVDNLDLYVSVIPEIDSEIYHAMISEYGEKRVHQCFQDYILKLRKEDKDLYSCQLKVWEKLGYYLSLLDHNPFEEDILKLFEKSSKSRVDNSNVIYNEDVFYMEKKLFSLEEEIYYGFHLLKKDYITIFAKEDDFKTLDVEKIFSSIKSSSVCEFVLNQFSYMYEKCTRNSNFDVWFQKFLFEYRQLFVNGKVPDLRRFMEVSVDVEVLDEQSLMEQVRMYVDYSIAKDKFLLSNIFLVKSYVKKMRIQNAEEDFFTSGMMGLGRAIDTFDIRKGYKFTTYGLVGIKNYVLREYDNSSGIIRIPVYMKNFMFRLREKEKSFYDEHHRMPSISELAGLLHIREEKLLSNLNLVNSSNCLSLDCEARCSDQNSGDLVLMDLICDKVDVIGEFLQKEDFKKFLKYMKEVLTEREMDILLKRSGYSCEKPMTLEEVGKDYHISREGIRQIEGKAIRKLKETEYGRSFNPFR